MGHPTCCVGAGSSRISDAGLGGAAVSCCHGLKPFCQGSGEGLGLFHLPEHPVPAPWSSLGLSERMHRTIVVTFLKLLWAQYQHSLPLPILKIGLLSTFHLKRQIGVHEAGFKPLRHSY